MVFSILLCLFLLCTKFSFPSVVLSVPYRLIAFSRLMSGDDAVTDQLVPSDHNGSLAPDLVNSSDSHSSAKGREQSGVSTGDSSFFSTQEGLSPSPTVSPKMVSERDATAPVDTEMYGQCLLPSDVRLDSLPSQPSSDSCTSGNHIHSDISLYSSELVGDFDLTLNTHVRECTTPIHMASNDHLDLPLDRSEVVQVSELSCEFGDRPSVFNIPSESNSITHVPISLSENSQMADVSNTSEEIIFPHDTPTPHSEISDSVHPSSSSGLQLIPDSSALSVQLSEEQSKLSVDEITEQHPLSTAALLSISSATSSTSNDAISQQVSSVSNASDPTSIVLTQRGAETVFGDIGLNEARQSSEKRTSPVKSSIITVPGCYGEDLVKGKLISSTLGSSESAFRRVSEQVEKFEEHSDEQTAPPVESAKRAPNEPHMVAIGSTNIHSEQVLLRTRPPTLNIPTSMDVLTGPDPEVEHAVVLSDPERSPKVSLNTVPNMSRFSPAQVVAATGGAPAEVLRQIESGPDEDPKRMTHAKTTEFLLPPHRSLITGSRRGSAPILDPQPSTSRTALPPVNAQFAPTTTDSVAASSSVIFGNFLTETYRLEVSATAKASINSVSDDGVTVSNATAQASATVDSSPSPPIRPGATDSDRSDPMEAIVARNLALLGDEINRTYGPRLDSMIKILPADECPVEMFSNVARVLFSRGPTNWGQVVALFYFGYRLVIRRVRSGLLAAFRQVCKSLFSFCLQMNVFAWIAAQGGWRIVQYLTFSGVGSRGDNEPPNQAIANGHYTDTTGVTLFGQHWLTPQNLIVGLTIVCTALYLYRRFNR
ncbi:uncharacterized protein DEA37_0003506 [Paragonimus westermani]|uniref:Bcl-2 Bcl-2 homology region 1-3 domain-containing protein n=1 Tax=Paragonimus westermani TaxID=34504 RepID=A0A5J4NZ58_9TREM|nr:uncharacterized protein DEA37_0003506 [Paragonimus westermani]